MANPKGVRTRNTPDWFSIYAAIGGYGVEGGFGTDSFKYVSLYNDSGTGAVLAVYVFQIQTNNVAMCDVFYVNGTIGSAVRPCTRVNPAVASPPGQMFYLDNGGSAIANAPFAEVSGFTPLGAAGGFPLFIVPAGYSLVAGPSAKDQTMILTTWYVPFRDLNLRNPI